MDKLIHQNEMKFRLLLTDGCNRNCSFCLNDFQPKPTRRIQFIDTSLALMGMEAYGRTVKSIAPLQLYLSGGEPTLHPNFTMILKQAHRVGRVTLNTNGNFPRSSKFIDVLRENTDCIHLGTYCKSDIQGHLAKALNASIQTVYTTIDDGMVDESFIEFYLNYGVPIKVFMDFKSNNTESYVEFYELCRAKYPNEDITFRFTGKQINRGWGCDNCHNKCITLKALWMFPDGGVSICPQLVNRHRKEYPSDPKSWKESFQRACIYHLCKFENDKNP